MADVLIIGAGPAGCSAALTLANRGLTAILAYASDGALQKAHRVDNYPGMAGVSGEEMLAQFRKEALSAGATLKAARVTMILPMGKTFSAALGDELISVRGVILTTGAARVKALENERKLLGRGVSYCATCDGMLYKGRSLAVIGDGKEAVAEANFLSTLASHVTYIAEKPHDLSALDPKITVLSARPLVVLGTDSAQGVKTDQGDVPADGVFILRGAVAPDALIPGLALSGAAIEHDQKMRSNLPRVCVAGDAAGAPYQIAKAVGEGCIAALTLAEELSEKPKAAQ